MFSLTLVTMLLHASTSTAALSSESVIVSHSEAPVCGEEKPAVISCYFDADPRNITKRVNIVQYNYQTYATASLCEIPKAREGNNATLICHFDNDLRNTKQGVKVVHYNSKMFDKTVFACLWHYGQADCIAQYGFRLYGEISNELRLINPRVTKEHAGTYACVVFDSEPETQDKCVLTVVDMVSHCEIPEVREGDNATLTCHFSSDLRNTKQGVKVVQYNPQAIDSSSTKTLNEGCCGSALDFEREMFPLLLPMLKAACVLATVIITLLVAIIFDHVYRKYVSRTSATEKK